jgi:hypothetical protein
MLEWNRYVPSIGPVSKMQSDSYMCNHGSPSAIIFPTGVRGCQMVWTALDEAGKGAAFPCGAVCLSSKPGPVVPGMILGLKSLGRE